MFDYPTQTINGHQRPVTLLHARPFTMKRVIIIGSSGAGKSTLARMLGRQLQLPVIHLDRYYWRPGWVGMPFAEWESVMTRFAQKARWIIDGNYRATLDVRLHYADTVLFLDLPPWLCAWRLIKRRVQYRNQTRPDIAEGCHEPLFSRQLFQAIYRVLEYPNRARRDVLRRLDALPPDKRVFRLRTPEEVRQFVAFVGDSLPAHGRVGGLQRGEHPPAPVIGRGV